MLIGTAGTHFHAQLIFVFLVETGFSHVGQAGLKLLTSGDPLASASQSTGNTAVSPCTPPSLSDFDSRHAQILEGASYYLSLLKNLPSICPSMQKISIEYLI